MPLVPVKTGDGSHTLFDTEKNLYFRSLQGARSESDYVFFSSSRLSDQPAPRAVLELGLGTALNFLYTADRLLLDKAGETLDYYVVEAAPLSREAFTVLQHRQWLQEPALAELVENVLGELAAAPESHQNLGPIRLHAYKSRWQDLDLPPELEVQAIYHDPFGPKDNPECWQRDCFRWSGRHLSPTGRLVTYAASTQMRRELVAAGLCIASLPGSGRKREMTVAARHEAALADAQPLKQARFYT